MKKIKIFIALTIMVFSASSFTIFSPDIEEVVIEPQFSGVDCSLLAIQYYDTLTHGEVDSQAAFAAAYELLVHCESNQ